LVSLPGDRAQDILKEVKRMADNIREGDNLEEINSDWKFAAMVRILSYTA
jgi:hypothetical protein